MACPRYGEKCNEFMCGNSVNGICAGRKEKQKMTSWEEIKKMYERKLIEENKRGYNRCICDVANMLNDLEHNNINFVRVETFRRLLYTLKE